MALVVDLNAGQLAALIGVINVLLPILISGIGVLAIFMSTSDKMTALEWTTLSKISQNIPLSYFGTGGQPALTGIRLWSLGSYKRNVLYLLIGICPILLYGASAIAPLELSQVRTCGLFEFKSCLGMIDNLHVDDTYLTDFNKSYSNFAMRYRLLDSYSDDNITFPTNSFKMSVVTSTKKGYGIVDTMVVDHDNGGLLMNHAIGPKEKVGEKYNWSIKGMWLQPHVICKSTNFTQVSNKNGTFDWQAKLYIKNTDMYPPQINPIGDRGQMTDLSYRSSRYSTFINLAIRKKFNLTNNGNYLESSAYSLLTSPETINKYSLPKLPKILTSDDDDDDLAIDISCDGFGGIDNLADNIVGVKCWKLLGPPKLTASGTEQILYGCASMIEASVNIIELQTNATQEINIVNKQTIPAQWYIEKSNVSIRDMDPWWGGVEFGENVPNNSAIVSENNLLLPAGTAFFSGNGDGAQSASAIGGSSFFMSNINFDVYGYNGDGTGNLALLNQWKEEGTTEEGISRMFQRQWTDIMINMVTPTNDAKIIGQVQIMKDKTCYDLRYATQYFIAIIGLIIIILISLPRSIC
ncbi:hypothetical protein GLOIN_2v1834517 [Rhizophagus irregularis DAOM 181602=DAOM 197198]|uniref:Uncharacterized protein n=1 Tax=Rhizophagus irregularis (strain DAOM 181602 / DAOM 197198 / MUCL 43194) TaxID=747089 RepID=A0A2P4QWU4_RHIID|nr:hypothetical protein GLOIN_2v1834517 [Rhizophagus irregularis DAOM 181602=DAOM 197198]POG82116.1 hypothetical protein GLOIN_2v1834517 [Rhizophagus irregularis DAOM 181602=DAOM 197198]|eukprot:XP_025188982.1 hypothetical protein GLOIN_2v1834517 [Rhizophagus irregularis DAOM 181602=DAOM 197198]